MAISLSDLIPLPFGGYFFLSTAPTYSDVESTLSVFLVVATLMFGCVISALMGNLGDEVENVLPLFYQSTACFGYLVMLILMTYMYFTTHVHQENKEALKAEMAAFVLPWAFLVTVMLILFIVGTLLYLWGLSYIRDDRMGREIAGEIYVGNTWQNAVVFSLILASGHMSFIWVQMKSSVAVKKSGIFEGVTDATPSSGASKEADPAKDAEVDAKIGFYIPNPPDENPASGESGSKI